MASGDTLACFTPQHNQQPNASGATLDLRNNRPVLDFDPSADEVAVFLGVLPRNYGGGGITIYLHWAATSATSGSCRWQTAIEALSGLDLDGDSFASANSAGGTANGTNGIETVTSIAHADGAEMDSLAAGGAFRLKVTRDADGTSGTDDMTGDAELVAVEIKET
jgi:hypothetical protein